MLGCALVQSSLVKIDLDAGKVVQRWDDIGTKVHAIVAWRDAFLVLDSEAAALVSVNPRTGDVKRLYKARCAAALTASRPAPGAAGSALWCFREVVRLECSNLCELHTAVCTAESIFHCRLSASPRRTSMPEHSCPACFDAVRDGLFGRDQRTVSQMGVTGCRSGTGRSS